MHTLFKLPYIYLHISPRFSLMNLAQLVKSSLVSSIAQAYCVTVSKAATLCFEPSGTFSVPKNIYPS